MHGQSATFRGLSMSSFFLLALAFAVFPSAAGAQTLRGVVVEQTGLMLPGVQLELRRGEEVVASATTAGDGTFGLPATTANEIVRAQLDGFETTDVAANKSERIV